MVNYHNIVDLIIMGRKKSVLPTYLEHAPSGQARIVWGGKTIYLGKYGSPESHAKHAQICAEIMATGSIMTNDGRIRVVELVAKFMADMHKEYTERGSREAIQMQRAMNYLVESHGQDFADEISPRKLLILQKAWIAKPMAKATVNMYTSYIVRLFEWASRYEYVSPQVWHGLQSVGRIKERHAVKPTKIVRTVDWSQVEAIRSHIAPVLWAVIQVQWFTGMRAEEVLRMTPGQIDQANWCYSLTEHKTKAHMNEKLVFLGPQVRAVIEPYLKDRPADMPLFSPVEAQAQRYQKMRAERKTKVQPSQKSRAKQSPARRPGLRYQNTSYFRAIRAACERAGIEPWSSHQLRHSKATIVRKQFGLEGTQLTLGHKSIKTSEIYAEPDMELAKRIAEETG